MLAAWRPSQAGAEIRTRGRVRVLVAELCPIISSVAPLAIGWWINLPALFQRLADFGLGEFFLL